MMKTCGIIGGMGPEATAVFYMKLMRRFKNKEAYPPVLMYSIAETFEFTNNFLRYGGSGIERLTMILKGLEITQNNANFYVIPCNTAHIYIDEIRRNSKIPVISIVEETCNFLYKSNFKRIGVLASGATIDCGVYTNPFSLVGMTAVIPTKDQQARVSEIIVSIVKGEKNMQDKEDLLEIIACLRDKGAECILLACTDLPLLIEKNEGDIPIVDTMDILVDAAVLGILDV